MMTVTLQEVKDHLRVISDEEDGLIESMLNAAIAYVTTQVDEVPDPTPAPIKAAVLLLVGDLFENRERQAITGVGGFQENPTFRLLLNPYRCTEVL